MYRSASRLLTRSLAAAGRRGRPFSTDLPAASPSEDTAFVEAWKKVSPNIEPPKTPLSFMKPRPPTPSSIPSKLTVNFVLPYQSEISSKEVVVHCDLKPGNVLLDEDMTAHVSDFGIAKLLLGNSSTVTSTNAPGTIGYMAPEYASTGRISRRGDVYSFGILLLEIFTRKKPTDPMFFGESSLRRWVCEARSTALLEIVDCNLLKDGSGNQMTGQDLTYMHACLSSIIELGIICSRDSPQERSSMKETVPRLQKIKMDHISMFPNA